MLSHTPEKEIRVLEISFTENYQSVQSNILA